MMNRITVMSVVVVACFGCAVSGATKRSLIFSKGSRFFVRINTKENLLKYTNIFAHGVGYRMAWDLPDKVDSGRRIQRRDLYNGIETLLTRNEINGQVCMKKFICEARLKLKYYNDFVSRLARLIFTPDGNDDGHYVSHENCRRELSDCPISLLSFLHV